MLYKIKFFKNHLIIINGRKQRSKVLLCLTFKNHRVTLIVRPHAHFRMWFLTDRSTPAGLSLCPWCGLLATATGSYCNGMGRRREGGGGGGSTQRGGLRINTAPTISPPSSAEQLQRAGEHKGSAACLNITGRITEGVRDQWTITTEWWAGSQDNGIDAPGSGLPS